MKTGIVLLTVLLSGCGFFSRTKNTFYSLEPIPFEGPVANLSGTPIGIEGIELPPGLDRREIAIRGADHRLEVRGSQQWGSPLEEMVIHTLAFNLAKRLPGGMVILPGQAKPAAMRSVYVVFEDLAARPDNVFVLDARWTLGTRTEHERITVNLDSTESAKVVAGMSSALATLADRIALKLTHDIPSVAAAGERYVIFTGTGSTPQISRAYSAIVRSAEKNALRAVLRIDMRVH